MFFTLEYRRWSIDKPRDPKAGYRLRVGVRKRTLVGAAAPAMFTEPAQLLGCSPQARCASIRTGVLANLGVADLERGIPVWMPSAGRRWASADTVASWANWWLKPEMFGSRDTARRRGLFDNFAIATADGEAACACDFNAKFTATTRRSGLARSDAGQDQRSAIAGGITWLATADATSDLVPLHSSCNGGWRGSLIEPLHRHPASRRLGANYRRPDQRRRNVTHNGGLFVDGVLSFLLRRHTLKTKHQRGENMR